MGRARNRLKFKPLISSAVLTALVLVLALGRGAMSRPTGMMQEGIAVISDVPASQGVLILAHGGNRAWNANVVRTLKAVGERPMVVHFGMGIQDASHLERSLRTLEACGVQEVLVIPLFVSSHSLIIRQLKFLLGLRANSPFDTGLSPIKTEMSIRMTPALDGAPEVGEILRDRLRSVSVDSAREVVVIVAHGPVEDSDNERWLGMMERVKAQLERDQTFKAVHFILLRDDAPSVIRNDAAHDLRQVVKEAVRAGDCIVLPLLISSGGIEGKIWGHLEGLEYRFVDQGLLPHPQIQHWVARNVRTGFKGGT